MRFLFPDALLVWSSITEWNSIEFPIHMYKDHTKDKHFQNAISGKFYMCVGVGVDGKLMILRRGFYI